MIPSALNRIYKMDLILFIKIPPKSPFTTITVARTVPAKKIEPTHYGSILVVIYEVFMEKDIFIKV